MAKQALLNVLQTTLGRYVTDLDVESLSLSLWSGKIELHKGLTIDANAVNRDFLSLGGGSFSSANASSVQVKSGSIGKVTVEVPWKSLARKAVVVRISGVRLVLSPATGVEEEISESAGNDEQQMKEQLLEKRRAAIEDLDKVRINQDKLLEGLLSDADNVEDVVQSGRASLRAEGDTEKAKNEGFVARLIRRIVENLHIEIKDVHTKFASSSERMDTEGSSEFAAGVVLESLVLQTTDKEGKRTFVDRKPGVGDFLYKAFDISGFGIYLQDHPIDVKSMESIEDSSSAGFILSKGSFKCKLRQADDSDPCTDHPKFLITTYIPSTPVSFSRRQFELVQEIAKELDAAQRVRPLFPQYRPLRPISSETAKLWWKYAFRCVGRLNGNRAWAEFMTKAKQRRQYIALYKRQKHGDSCDWLTPLTEEEEKIVTETENDRTISIDAIVSWREMADAQVKKEREKYWKEMASGGGGGIWSFLFGSSESSEQKTSQEPAVSLSVEEIKELEGQLAVMSDIESTISEDSRLLEVKFRTGSYSFELLGRSSESLTSLTMGSVEMSFSTKINGKDATLDLTVGVLGMEDFVTQESLFPSVLRNIKDRSDSSSPPYSLQMNFKTLDSGDMKVTLSTAPVEIVASPRLVKEIRDFVAVSPGDTLGSEKKTQVGSGKDVTMEQRQTSGGVVQDESKEEGTEEDEEANPLGKYVEDAVDTVSDQLAKSLVEAWKARQASTTKLHLDCVIHAPIVVIPKSCTDREAPVIVVDFGKLQVASRDDPSAAVQKSFETKMGRESTSLSPLDNWELRASGFSLLVGASGSRDWYLDTNDSDGSGSQPAPGGSEVILRPLEFGLDVSVESSSSHICADGSFSHFQITLTSKRISKIVKVAATWSSVAFGSLEGQPSPSEAHVDDKKSEGRSPIKEKKQKPGETPLIYASFSLQKVSVAFLGNKKNKAEVSLATVTTSFSSSSEGAYSLEMNMGGFWVIDQENPSLQPKILMGTGSKIGSTLFPPNRTSSVSGYQEKSVEIFEDSLEEEVSSSEWANMSVMLPGNGNVQDNTTKISAAFSELLFCWHVKSVARLLSLKEEIMAQLEETYSGEADLSSRMRPSISSAENSSLTFSTRRLSGFRDSIRENLTTIGGSIRDVSSAEEGSTPQSTITMNVELQSLVVSLYAEKDDSLLYALSMSGTSVDLKQSEDSLNASLELGDFRVEASVSDVLPMYKPMLGISPDASTSLLTMKYTARTRGFVDSEKRFKTSADLQLSKMKFVCLYKQIILLSNYLNDGVLGTITSAAAEGAANAAKEVASSDESSMLVHCSASGFEVVVPQEAQLPKAFVLRMDDLSSELSIHPELGKDASVELKGFIIENSEGVPVIQEPIRMKIHAVLPGRMSENQEQTAELDIAKSSFFVTKGHYKQILETLYGNLGEPLPEDEESADNGDKEYSRVHSQDRGQYSTDKASSLELSENNDGTEIQDTLRLVARIEEVSLHLCGSDLSDTILRFGADRVDASAWLKTSENESKTTLTISKIEVEDQRKISSDHAFRYLFNNYTTDTSDKDGILEIRQVGHGDGSQEISLNLDAVQVTILPELLAEVIDFASVETTQSAPSTGASAGVHEVERPTGEVSRDAVNRKSVKVSFDSKGFRMLLVEVEGTETGSNGNDLLSSAFVFEGRSDAQVDLTFSSADNSLLGSGVEVNGHMEMYVADKENLADPVQLMDPFKFSVGVKYVVDNGKRLVEANVASLSALDVALSMRDAARAAMIISSITDTLKTTNEGDVEDSGNAEVAADKSGVDIAEQVADEDEAVDGQTEKPYTEESIPKGDGESEILLELSSSVSLPDSRLVLLNDFGSREQALIKFATKNLSIGTHLSLRGPSMNIAEPLFDIKLDLSLLSEYFDATKSSWEKFLLEPWDVSITAERKEHKVENSQDKFFTALDIKSNQCHVSFADQFISRLGAASKLWSVFSGELVKGDGISGNGVRDEMPLTETGRAELLADPVPYGIVNHTGVEICYVFGNEDQKTLCKPGDASYFSFSLPKSGGIGGKRLFGQDASEPKSVWVSVGCDSIAGEEKDGVMIENLDSEMDWRQQHTLKNGSRVFSEVVTSKATILMLRSSILIHNWTAVPFVAAFKEQQIDKPTIVGVSKCGSQNSVFDISASYLSNLELDPASSISLGIPGELIQDGSDSILSQGARIYLLSLENSDWETYDSTDIANLPDNTQQPFDKWAFVDIPPLSERLGQSPIEVEVVYPDTDSTAHPRVIMKVDYIAEHPLVDLYLQPRMTLVNESPVSFFIRTPLQRTYSLNTYEMSEESDFPGEKLHRIDSSQSLQVLTPGPLVNFAVRCAHRPVAGGTTGWMIDEWVTIPLSGEERISKPVKILLPFENDSSQGQELFLSEQGTEADLEATFSKQPRDCFRMLSLNVCNIVVDHAGKLLFEASQKKKESLTLSTFTCPCEPWRLTLLPDPKIPICATERSGEKPEDHRKARPFLVDEISIGDGGVNSSPLQWEDGSPSGYFAFRRPGKSVLDTNEIHVIPHYMFFNGSNAIVKIKLSSTGNRRRSTLRQSIMGKSGGNDMRQSDGGDQIVLDPGERLLPSKNILSEDLSIVIEFVDRGISGGPVKVGALGLQLCQLNSNADGRTVGTVAVQTISGGKDAKFVITLGNPELDKTESKNADETILKSDFLRFRVRLHELKVLLNSTEKAGRHGAGGDISSIPVQTELGTWKIHMPEGSSDGEGKDVSHSERKDTLRVSRSRKSSVEVARLTVRGMTFDFQRVFLDEDELVLSGSTSDSNSSERSRVAFLIREVRFEDCNPEATYPKVIESTPGQDFVDFAVHVQGPLSSRIIDMIDLNVSSTKNSTGAVKMSTSEEFLWDILDLLNQISVAVFRLSGGVEYNSAVDHLAEETQKDGSEVIGPVAWDEEPGVYSAPRSDMVYDFRRVRVSPISLELSFERRPQKSRYGLIRGGPNAKIVNYFLRQLKFSLRRSKIFFNEYLGGDIKGPTDQLASLISAVYISRLKFKWLKLVSALSIDDWSVVAGRTDGEEEFVLGDLSRSAGLLAGFGASSVLKKVSSTVGDQVENATDLVGLGAVGGGVNEFVTGVGDGAGRFVAGAGKGAGQVIGSVGTGLEKVGKGLRRGIKDKNPGHALYGIGEGAVATGVGVSKGIQSTAKGAIDGFVRISNGFFAGANSTEVSFGGSLDGGIGGRQMDSAFVTHKYRWIVLTVLALAIMSNSSLWVTFYPFSEFASKYFFGKASDSQYVIDIVTLLHPLTYFPGTFLSSILAEKKGLEAMVKIGAIMTTVAAAVRWIGAIFTNGGRTGYALILVGHSLAGISLPFLLNAIGLLEANWFGIKDNVIAVSVGTTSLLAGVALTTIVVPLFLPEGGDSGHDNDRMVSVYHAVLLFQFLGAAVSAVLCYTLMRSLPPTPPSKATALREYRRRRLLPARHVTFQANLSVVEVVPSQKTGMRGLCEACGVVMNQLSVLLCDRHYWTLLLSFMFGPSLFCSSVFSMKLNLLQCSYSDKEIEYFYNVLLLFGVLGSIATTVILRWFRWYRTILKSISFLLSCTILLLLLGHNVIQDVGVATTMGCVGFFVIPLFIVHIELILEGTYPLNEDLSTGIVFASSSLIVIAVVVAMYALGSHAECIDEGLTLTPQTGLLAAGIFVGTVCACMYSGPSKRLQIKEARRGGTTEVDPLLPDKFPV